MDDSRSSNDRQAALVGSIAAVTQGALPLAPGLRAAAQEAGNRRAAAELNAMAAELEQGRLPEEVFATPRAGLPVGVPAILLASGACCGTRETLLDVVDQDAMLQDTLTAVRSALTYPVFLLIFAYACFMLVEFVVIGHFAALFKDFQLESSLLLFRLHGYRWWLLLTPLTLTFVLTAIYYLVLKRETRHRVRASLPIFGPMWHWCGVAQATRSLSHLVARQMPLPVALRLSARGLRDANVAAVWTALAEEVERGQSLSLAILATYRLPASLSPLVFWGEKSGQLAESLLHGSDYFAERVRLRAQLVRTIAPPILFVFVGCCTLFVVMAMMDPLRDQISSWFGWF